MSAEPKLMTFLTGPIRAGHCGLSEKNARTVIKCTGQTLSSIEDFYVMFGRDEMEKILTKGGVSIMYTTQVLRAIERDVKKKKEGDEDKEEEEKVDANTEEDAPPAAPPLNISQSIAEVMKSGILVPEVTPRSKKKLSSSRLNLSIQDNLPGLLNVINADLAGYIDAPDALVRRLRGTRRITIEELTILVQTVCSTDNGEDKDQHFYRVVQKLFVACDRFAITGEFFNPNALVSILQFSEYGPNQICVQYFWNQIARRELLGSNRAGDASWAFKFCVQHMIYATIAQAFKQRMFELKKMIQNGERQLDALREWKQTQRMMGNVPHRRNDQDVMDVDDLEIDLDEIGFYAKSFAYNFCKDLRIILDKVLDTAMDRALRVPTSSRLFDSMKPGIRGQRIYRQVISHVHRDDEGDDDQGDDI